ncbi:MAG: TIGR00282 family metallophosphoesterase [Patescibacteria group bacterium]|nr:TIGR00282 family metallophosphoesterase [Patescibacteria group bacterium]
MKILFFGDIVGRIGRQAIKQILPELKQELNPDLILANAENSAHGVGFTSKIINELREAGIDFFTSGNHVLSKPEAEVLLVDPKPIVIRPANYPDAVPGKGFRIIEVGSKSVMIVNLMGQVFMKEELDSPFQKIDEILKQELPKNLAAIIVDFHAEATSEKAAFGWYVDGRVSAVLGTHTHVPTADHKVLPSGTAFVSDVGMVGATDSIIGDTKEPIIQSFVDKTTFKLDIPEVGEVSVNAVLLEIDHNSRQAKSIVRVDRKVKVL